MREMFVLEWSPSQRCFHIQLLDEALESNRRRFSTKPHDMFDWIPMFIGTYRECEIVAQTNQHKLDKQQLMESTRWTH
jgi:hypothetical protein